jgi:hypothetical protein
VPSPPGASTTKHCIINIMTKKKLKKNLEKDDRQYKGAYERQGHGGEDGAAPPRHSQSSRTMVVSTALQLRGLGARLCNVT